LVGLHGILPAHAQELAGIRRQAAELRVENRKLLELADCPTLELVLFPAGEAVGLELRPVRPAIASSMPA
jgi:hypothetical protein